jgi:hypothetical protein
VVVRIAIGCDGSPEVARVGAGSRAARDGRCQTSTLKTDRQAELAVIVPMYVAMAGRSVP